MVNGAKKEELLHNFIHFKSLCFCRSKAQKQKVSWSNSLNNFEDAINAHAKQGWRVINVYSNVNGGVYALLEKDKNR
ncbi:DUF4177 domain-containing protein [Polaribacter staleyi]|uniref:DUF4177 domain-containing protein n=1 Tax=Polaribacter staleyi TaxID=2022337 RepID=UPI003BF546E4